MALRFYNTLSQQVETFTPLSDRVVRMYTCGPTVYNYIHIGNLRTFTFQDILRRWLRARGYTLDHVMNITDVEDKIIRNAAAANKSIYDYTAVYTDAFLEDMATLRLERPERMVKATDHIPEMVSMIEELSERGYTYATKDRYISVLQTSPDYGKLSHHDFSGIRAGARVDVDEYDKEDARDFVLWKATKAENRAGKARSARAVPAGTSSAPSCRWSISARRSIFTRAASTSCSRITKTRSRNRKRSPGSNS